MQTISEAAEAAREAQAQKARDDAAARRESSFDNLAKTWNDKYRGFGRLAGTHWAEMPIPDRSEFEYVPYPGYQVFKGSRSEHVYGWRIVLDDIPFLLAHGESGWTDFSLYVIIGCPQCGAEGATTFYDLADLGKALKQGPPDYAHTCFDRETKEVAYALGKAARELGYSAHEIAQMAIERHSDLIFRTMTR